MTSAEPPLTQLGRALAHVDELNQNVDRLTEVVNTERATRLRWRVTMVVLVVLSLANLVGLGFAYQAADNAQQTGHTLNDCLIPGGDCAARLAKEGRSGAVRQMDYQACWAAVPIERRNPEVFEDCKARILDQVISNEGGK